MEKIYKDALVRLIRERVDCIINPIGFQNGYMTLHGAEERLSELLVIACRLCLYEVEGEIKAARRPIREEINRQSVRYGGQVIFTEP